MCGLLASGEYQWNGKIDLGYINVAHTTDAFSFDGLDVSRARGHSKQINLSSIFFLFTLP